MTADEYAAALKALLPSGPAWAKEPGSNLSLLTEALGQEFARVDASGQSLLAQFEPRLAVSLLPEWERALGLPDECAELGSTIGERQAYAFTRFTQRGRQRPADYVQMANDLGYDDVDLTENDPGVHQFTITVNEARVTFFRCGTSRCGDALGEIQRAEDLECILQKLKPAHTEAFVSYVGV